MGAALPDRLQWFRLGVLQGDGLQRRAHLAQHAHAGVGGSLRPHGHDDDVRDAPDEFEPRGHGAAGSDGEALSQLAVDHSSGPSATRSGNCRAQWPSRARRLRADMVRRCHELDPTRVVSAAVNGDNEQGRLRRARHHRLQLQPADARTSTTRSIPSGPSTARRPSSAICTRGVYVTDPLRNYGERLRPA